MSEAGRVLRPGGTYLGTWFLVDDESAQGVLPSGAAGVACQESVMRAALSAASLQLEVLHPGAWRATPDAPSYQDLVVARRSAD